MFKFILIRRSLISGKLGIESETKYFSSFSLRNLILNNKQYKEIFIK